MKTYKLIAVEALDAMAWYHLQRVNLYRGVFAKYSPTEMQELHGATGLTRAQILAEAEKLIAKFDEVTAWLKDAT